MEYEVYFDDNHLLVKERGQKYPINLQERVLQFAVDIIKFLMQLPRIKEFDVIRYQLSKSATSIGANYEESQAGSYAQFIQRIQICLREARESHFWLKVIDRLQIQNLDVNLNNRDFFIKELHRLLQEAEEIKLIFGSIASKVHHTT